MKFISGNIFDSECQTLVCPVNTVGVMGKGLALEFKRRWPEVDNYYRRLYKMEAMVTGSLWDISISEKRRVLLFPTKTTWREPSKLIYIQWGLSDFAHAPWSYGVKSIAFPALGCGLGGLDWNDVKPLMERYLSQLSIPVEVYLPERKHDGKHSHCANVPKS